MKTNKILKILWILSIAFLWLPQAHADVTVYQYGFELGMDGWFADNGVWEAGAPSFSSEPPGPYEGFLLIGTIVGGPDPPGGLYPPDTDSRLISPEIQLPAVAAGEEIYLTFWQWFSYYGPNSCDYGIIQIRYDTGSGSWSGWANLDENVFYSSGVWSKRKDLLTAYAGKKVQIGFLHVASTGGTYGVCDGSSTGWYIDDVQIVKKVPEWTGDFEFGWSDWGANRGLWEVGTPTAGPQGCLTGSQCVGTVLDDDYPDTSDSRLISPEIQLPAVAAGEKIDLTFSQWFSYYGPNSCDYGIIQIRTYDEDTDSWSIWSSLGDRISGSSPSWSQRKDELTAYAGKKVQIGFLHVASTGGTYGVCNGSSTGWYIDHIRIEKLSPEICWCDLNGDGICNILDWPLFIQDWGRTNCGTPPGTGDPPNDCECDINMDGKCNIVDWPLFVEDWGKANWCPK
jgi:hypothetical protein